MFILINYILLNLDRLWLYQKCTEFGFFQTTNYPGVSFAPHLPLDYFIQMCSDVFGRPFDKKTIQSSVEHTNAVYGGNSLTNQSKIVFVNGLEDPWRLLSVLEEKASNPTVFTMLIPKTSRNKLFYSPTPYDSPELKKARVQLGKLIKQFLN